MLTLAVDTSTRCGSLAVLSEGALLGQVVIPPGEPSSSRFAPSVDLLLREAGVSLSQLDLFAVSAGPGSFTGLRIGLTAVKAWAEVFQKPIASVSVLEAIALLALHSGDLPRSGLVVPAFDARRGQLFGAMYQYSESEPGRLRLFGEEVVTGPEEFLQSVGVRSNGSALFFASTTPEVVEAALALSSFPQAARVVAVSSTLAPTIGLLGYQQALRGETVDALRLDASYVRRTDAELKWKEQK